MALKFAKWALQTITFVGLSITACAALAEDNAIESISTNQQGSNVIVKVLLKNSLTKPPIGFSISSPARIALDFAGTVNATGKTSQDINLGDVRNVNVVQAGERSRLVFNLPRPLNYATVIEDRAVIVTIDGSGGVATAVNSIGVPVAPVAPAVVAGSQSLRDIDFRRGVNGEGRIVVDLPNSQIGVDVRQQGQVIIVDFLKTALPAVLRRRLDVGDFGTPVTTITTTPQGENVHMVIEPKGLWEHSAYQSDTQLVIEVKPIKEEQNKLTQGTQGYRGDKLSLNFQSVEVRALLQVIADFTGLNIITSDTVSGNLTLRLKDVPWDQALDIVMQAKGLDMRKNGSVLWIAPKDELLTKEKLELEQKAQIAELEPLKTEIFQLNYQKAESFKMVFGLEGADTKNRMLSKRGSATIDPRTNKLIVTDIAAKLEEVRKLIAVTDIATRQVLIEARIVEADDSFGRSLGSKLGMVDLRGLRGGDAGFKVNGSERALVSGTYTGVGEQTTQTPDKGSGYNNAQFTNLPAAAVSGALGTPGSLAVSLFSAAANRFLNLELSALEADGKGKIISSPRVVTADQQAALIEAGEEIPYLKETASGASTVEFKKANLSMNVTPQITPDGNVILLVDVNKDSRGTITPAGYSINTKHVRTNVQVENGGTVVLGGIYLQSENDSETRIPFLGNLPVVGNLFKSTTRANTRSELLIFITPKIVTDRLSQTK